jgi:hypothetical protein
MSFASFLALGCIFGPLAAGSIASASAAADQNLG